MRMQIFWALAMLLGGRLCFADDSRRLAAELPLDPARQQAVERMNAQRDLQVKLHARATALANLSQDKPSSENLVRSRKLRLMMVMPNRIPPATLQYFVHAHPIMSDSHVITPLMRLAEFEIDYAARTGVSLPMVQSEVDFLIGLAQSSLEKVSITQLRQLFDLHKPVLGIDFATELLRELKMIKVTSPDPTVVLPPLFGNLVGHVNRGLKLARWLACDEREITDICNWLQAPRLRRHDPHRQLDDGHTETPPPIPFVTRGNPPQAECSNGLVETPPDDSLGESLRTFPER